MTTLDPGSGTEEVAGHATTASIQLEFPITEAGNAVVLKPAQLTPWSGSELGRIVAERTDIPAGIFTIGLPA